MIFTPASAPVKKIATTANEKCLPVSHLDVSHAFVQALLKEKIYKHRPPLHELNSLGKSYRSLSSVLQSYVSRRGVVFAPSKGASRES